MSKRIVPAPEARRNRARSEAKRNSGEQINHIRQPLKGVTENAVGSKVALVKRQTMRAQNHLEFLEKRNHSMMFFLPLDVTTHLRNLRLTHRKCAISFLTRESRGVSERSRYPTGRVCLQLADDFRNGLVLSQLRQDVNMIDRSVNDQRNSIFFADRATEVLMNSSTNCSRQPWFAPLRGKNNVIEQIAIGGTHNGGNLRRPSSGALLFLHNTPGVPLRSTPGFNPGAPFGGSRGNRQGVTERISWEQRDTRGAGVSHLSAEGAVQYSPEYSTANSGNRFRIVLNLLPRRWRRTGPRKRKIPIGQLT